MFNFREEFPAKYQNCFDQPELLKQYLKEADFIKSFDTMLYRSQSQYFKNTPDHIGDFFLAYRKSLLSALNKFEYTHISLDSFIGEMLKIYRLNFYKNISLKRKKEEKMKLSSHLEYLEQAPLEEDNHQLIYLSSSSSTVDLDYLIDKVKAFISSQENNQKNLPIEEKKILLLLLLEINEYITVDKRNETLQFIKVSARYFDTIVIQKKQILTEIMNKRSEVKRLLNHCYLNYLVTQEKLSKQRDQEQEIKYDKIKKRLKMLRNKYQRIRIGITKPQIAKLTGISFSEIMRYNRLLSKIILL